ncbi:hypothetical protein C8R43DRAFT_971654 [Mycena crocata]|nr:hypothetical protein C8R43DRAFT_971654 [Mycena crocata]
MDINKFLSPHSAEARAHTHVAENGTDWEPSIDETVLAHCASYRSFERYLAGKHEIFILPGTKWELERILRRYSTDAIHNAIAKSRSTLEAGGYSRVCHLAINSIQEVLNTGDNVAYLLALHAPAKDNASREEGPTPSIPTT